MKAYRPLVIQDLGLMMPGMAVHGLRLNEHTPEPVMTAHDHDHDQLVVYLEGKGEQKVNRTKYLARPGTIIGVKRGAVHSFERHHERVALCLVIDLELDHQLGALGVHSQMTATGLAQVKQWMTRLLSLEASEKKEMHYRVGALVLEILDVVLKTSGWLKPLKVAAVGMHQPTTRSAERIMLRDIASDMPLDAVAQRMGYQRDHLNRLLKAECGQTLGQVRSRLRVKQAMQLLRQGYPVNSVGERVGIADHNYFSRWFRQQTGMTPTSWKRNPKQREGGEW